MLAVVVRSQTGIIATPNEGCYVRRSGPNIQLIHRHQHIPRLWEQNRYWQTQLLKHPRPGYYEEPEADLGEMPESVRMPTTRAGWNAERWRFRQKSHHTKKMHYEKWWRNVIGGRLTESAD